MAEKYKTKVMTPEGGESKSEELKEYHFSGEGIYEPLTITAHSMSEAQESYETKKVKIIN